MAKLFNFRCPKDLMGQIEVIANQEGLNKSGTTIKLIQLGIEALTNGVKSELELDHQDVRQDRDRIKQQVQQAVRQELEAHLLGMVEVCIKRLIEGEQVKINTDFLQLPPELNPIPTNQIPTELTQLLDNLLLENENLKSKLYKVQMELVQLQEENHKLRTKLNSA